MLSTFSSFGKQSTKKGKKIAIANALGTFNNDITGFVVDSVGRVYVWSWYMTSITNPSGSSVSATAIAMYDPATSTWTAIGNGFDSGLIFYGKLDSADNLYVTGNFSKAGVTTGTQITVNYIAKWNPNTSTWSALGSGANVGMNGGGRVLVIDSQDNVYVVGNFTSAGNTSVSANNIAKWTTSSNTWSALGTGVPSTNLTPYDMCIDSNNNIYVTGWIQGFAHLGKWTASTSTWSTIGTSLNNQGTALEVDSNNDVYVAGDFTTANGFSVSKIAKLSGTTFSSVGFTGTRPNSACLKIFNNALYSSSNNSILKYNGSTWTSVATGYHAIKGIYVDVDENVYYNSSMYVLTKFG